MIYDKLLKFQQLGITIEKDAQNPFFKNSYSSLNEVLSKVKEPLAKLQIAIIQSPQKEGLETRLVDTEDKSEVVSLTPYVGTVDMQKLGGAITYARRYALVAMLGLEDADDDGNTASQKPKGMQDVKGEPFTDKEFDI